MPQPRMGSAKGGLPTPLAEGVRSFAERHPECMDPEYQPLYLVTLTAAILVDRSPSASLIREFGVANSKLRKAVLGETDPKEPSLMDIIAGASDVS